MALAPNQQTQYDQLTSAGASPESAMNAASLVPISQSAPSPSPQMSSPSAPTTAPQGTANPLYTGATSGPGSLAPTSSPASTQPTAAQTTQAPTTNLQPGAQGADVQGLQNFLASIGYLSQAQISTGPGIYGPQTQAAVAKLQQDLGVNAGQYSGFYGPQTQAALAEKYKNAFAGTTGQAPESASAASTALDSYFAGQPGDTDAQGSFFSQLFKLNPVESMIFQQLSNLASSTTTQQSLTDLYTQTAQEQGLPALEIQQADVNKIMEGTEDDIRNEITSTGGMATESQIQALTTARNKTLLIQANYLQNVINAKNDYVDRIVSLTQADRQATNDELDRKLGITKTMFDMAETMQNNAKQNYQSVIDAVGWDGLAASVANNPDAAANIEQTFGLAPGELKALAAYQSPDEQKSALELKNLSLQNQKLAGEIDAGPAVQTQVIDLNGRKVLINSKTGQIISDIGAGLPPTPESGQQLALQQQNIQDTGKLLTSPALGAAVGPNDLARVGPISYITGATSNFIAGVEQLRQQLTLDQLVSAKANGATFGALSDAELQLLSASATKLGTWAIKDKAGNVTGYNIDEGDFKNELQKINNFQRLDFILKGGDPASVGAQQMPDGTLWVENTDGSKTKLQ